MWPENSAFSPKLHALQLYWDSVSLGALKKCPRYYQLSIVEGWSGREKSVDLQFGIFLHSSRERYYHARARGDNHEQGVDAALQYALTVTWDAERNRPWQGDSYKNRLTLAQCIVDYCDRWENDPLVTVIQHNKLPAVEVTFKFPLGLESEQGEEFWLCGHLDRVVEFQGRTWISDLKSTRHEINERYMRQYKVHNQFSIYTLAGQFVLHSKIAGIIVDACQVLATQPARFKRALVERTEAQLAEFVQGLRVLLRQAESYARANFWPMNERACMEFGRPCEFLEICGRSPGVRAQWLKSDFVKRHWNPTIERGDV